ncbi:hypothetical protein L7F22_054639 [Adiantum nelumboides]|nr:hypothetical protein [Adiantum nelumboides]
MAAACTLGVGSYQPLNLVDEVAHVQRSTCDLEASEDEKIRAFVDGSAACWQQQLAEKAAKRPRLRYSSGSLLNNSKLRKFSISKNPSNTVASTNYILEADRLYDATSPPPGYVCARCYVPGHFIHVCPTIADPHFDRAAALKRSRPPARQPDNHAFLTQIASIVPAAIDSSRGTQDTATTSYTSAFYADLQCPLCHHVMEEAVMASKCCMRSFCDACIRSHLLSHSLTCYCGASNVLADDLLPNVTLRNGMHALLQLAHKKADQSHCITANDLDRHVSSSTSSMVSTTAV